MKSVNALAQQTITATQQQAPCSAALNAQSKGAVLTTSTYRAKHDTIFEFCMTSLLPILMEYWREFTNKYPDEKSQRFIMGEYAQRITLKGVTKAEQIKLGILKAKELRYRPNPEDFAKLCVPTPEELGLKDVKSALDELYARRGRYRGRPFEFSHRVLELVDERIGFKSYTMKEHEFVKLFAGEYEYWCNRFLNGDLPPARKALEYNTTPAKSKVEKYIENHGPVALGDDPQGLRIRALGKAFKQRFVARQLNDSEGKVA